MTDSKQAISPEKHASLIVWCSDAQTGKPILDALQHGFELDVRADLPDPGADISDEGSDILLLCLSPVETLCRAMAEGVVPSTALKDWLKQTQSIMQLNRRNRRKVRILDVDMAARHPGAFLRWFGLPEDDMLIAGVSQDGEGPVWDEVMQLLAQHTLLDDMSARRLLGELEAVSLNFANRSEIVPSDPDMAFRQYQTTLQFRQQVELLQAQNRYMQHELETVMQGKQQLSQGIENYQMQMIELRSEHSKLKGKAAEKERGLLQAGVMLQDMEAHVAYLTDAVSRHAEKRRQIMASKSYRLTTPLRKMRALMSGRKPD